MPLHILLCQGVDVSESCLLSLVSPNHFLFVAAAFVP